MKKLISILLVLIFTLSLTACGGSAGNENGDANEQKPILAETINKNALTGGDNVSFVFRKEGSFSYGNIVIFNKGVLFEAS